MSALFFFDKMLPDPRLQRTKRGDAAKRQLEVFEHENLLHVRIGPPGEENSGDQWTVVVPEEDARELLDGLERAILRAYGDGSK